LMYPTIIKRVFDVLFSFAGLILSSPVFLVISVFLCVGNKGSAFFIQQRPGRREKVFKLIKFKTMNDKTDASGRLLPDAERLTRIGRFVRKTSLDEIPQLINVLKGDMSLVGPRPLLVEYLPLYCDFQKRRHEVRPGITGWAQVNGRNAISWKEKFKLDVYYVDNVSFCFDVKILFLTVVKVFKGEGVNQPGQAGMEAFKGNN